MLYLISLQLSRAIGTSMSYVRDIRLIQRRDGKSQRVASSCLYKLQSCALSRCSRFFSYLATDSLLTQIPEIPTHNLLHLVPHLAFNREHLLILRIHICETLWWCNLWMWVVHSEWWLLSWLPHIWKDCSVIRIDFFLELTLLVLLTMSIIQSDSTHDMVLYTSSELCLFEHVPCSTLARHVPWW